MIVSNILSQLNLEIIFSYGKVAALFLPLGKYSIIFIKWFSYRVLFLNLRFLKLQNIIIFILNNWINIIDLGLFSAILKS